MAKFTAETDLTFTLKEGAKNKQFILSKGNDYELPENNEYIASLVGQGFLVPEAKEATDSSKNKKPN